MTTCEKGSVPAQMSLFHIWYRFISQIDYLLVDTISSKLLLVESCPMTFLYTYFYTEIDINIKINIKLKYLYLSVSYYEHVLGKVNSWFLRILKALMSRVPKPLDMTKSKNK